MEIVLCVTGSIAATETIKLAREFRRQGHSVKAFMTKEATKIIHPNALEFATGQEVVLELTGKIEHVKYSQQDLILVAPATANTISKFAYKISDNPVNTLLITAQGHDTPIVFVPSMHDSMYDAVSENVEKLKEEGIIAGGMLPKVKCCEDAIEKGVNNVIIMDGRVPHSILMELLTDEGAGTMVTGE